VLVTQSKEQNKLKNGKTKFIFGRIPPGSFEYEELNGFFSPKKAVQICEGDPACGGFTFKGTPNLSKRKYDIFFFHFVPSDVFEDKSKVQYYYWTSYLVKNRTFSKLQNFRIRDNSETASHGSCVQQRFNFYHKKNVITKTVYTQHFMISNFVIVNNIRNTYRFLQPTVYDLKLWNSKQYIQYHFRMLWQPNEPTNEQISDLMKEKDLAAIQIKSAGTYVVVLKLLYFSRYFLFFRVIKNKKLSF
jgi:hypothetical protein